MRHDKRPHKTTAFLILLALFLATGNALAQTSRIPCRTEAECQALKQAMAEQSAIQVPRMEEWPSEPLPLPGQLRGGGGVCSLWEDPVGCPLSQGPNDDGSSPYIPLPFTFNLYGQLYNGLWINNNGNVTFDQPYGTFTATPFPNNLFVMIAPFWADVDTRGIGEVFYCVTPTAIYVNWVDVGYYNSQTNLTNSFQLILTDGNDPVIGIGNNVAISYLDMQWTTGAASGGVGGFGGSPAVVGANLGNGTSFIQLGQFDQPGNAYDGPFGANDGVDWLDFKDFVFSTVNPNANVPPIIGGTTTCDSIVLCAGQSETLEIAFVSPEPNQITTASISSATFSNYTITSNVPGQTALMSVNVTPTVADVGFHQLELTGTDDGTPAETTTLTVVLNVLPPGVVIPPQQLDVCETSDPVDLFTLFPGNPPAGGSWSDPNGNAHSGVLDPSSDPDGSYSYSVGNGSLCPSFGSVDVSIFDQPDAGQNGTGTYCSVDPTVDLFTLLGGTPDPGGSWTDPGNGTHSGILDPALVLSGDYTYTLVATAPCMDSSATVTITVNTPLDPGIDAPLPTCASDDPADLFDALGGMPDMGGTWTDPNGVAASGMFDPQLDPIGAYTYTVSPLAPCPVLSAQVTVSVDPVPVAGVDATLQLCADAPQEDLFPLLGSGADPGGAWRDPDLQSHGGTLDPSLELSGPYEYVVNGIGACNALTDTAFVDVTVDPLPIVQFSADPVIGCDPLVVTFENDTDPQFLGNSDWDFGDGGTDVANGPLFHAFEDPGTYSVTLTVTTPAGCVDALTQTDLVHVDPAPEALFLTDPNPTTIEQSTVVMTATDPNAVAWQWDLGGLGQSGDQETEFTFPNTLGGQYLVCLQVVDQHGCEDQQCQLVVVKDPLLHFIPNAFTPDGDGVNDVFFPVLAGNDLGVHELLIYDRWGGLVFETNDPFEGWNGSYLGDGDEAMPSGVYVWKLRTKAEDNGERKDLIGSVTLLK
ncbi:MAG TPA: gliding motility-associated C-terminal domain-containing protein [Flavobacteriales bacterium]|nr:gliding motility-associated C-terminal domain-containing protein [Flavobacteriales bacterium]